MKKNGFKIIIDIIMTAIFLLLMWLDGTGVFWHEILGLYVGSMFILHLVLNWDWIKAVTQRFSKAKSRIKGMYILNVLLLVDMLVIIISGIFISQELFLDWFSVDLLVWSTIHHIASYFGLLLISVHIGLHWKMILCAFRKMLKITKESPLRKLFLRIAAGALAVAGIRSCFSTELWENVVPLYADKSVALSNTTTKVYLSASITQVVTTTVADIPTLQEYLSKLFCNGCSRHCPLSAPQCGRGVPKAAAAEQTYYATYTVSDAVVSEASSQTSSQASSQTATSTVTSQTVSQTQSTTTYNDDEDEYEDEVDDEEDEAVSTATSSEASVAVSSEAAVVTDTEEEEGDGWWGSLADALSIMGLVVGATYYTGEIATKKKKK